MSIPFLISMFRNLIPSYNRPTESTWSSNSPTYSTHFNDANAYDIVTGYENSINDTTETYASFASGARPRTSPGSSDSTCIYSGFGTGAYNGTINVSTSGSVSSGINNNGDVIEDGEVIISYSTTGINGPYTQFESYGRYGVEGTTIWTKDRVFAYTGAIDRANLFVKIEALGNSSGTTLLTYAAGSSNVDVYDIILG